MIEARIQFLASLLQYHLTEIEKIEHEIEDMNEPEKVKIYFAEGSFDL